jgi:hypothetical protein
MHPVPETLEWTGRSVADDGVAERREPEFAALLAEDLLPQDVGMPAVLGEFAQYVEVHPAQWERSAPVTIEPVVQT